VWNVRAEPATTAPSLSAQADADDAAPRGDIGMSWQHRAACRDADPDLFFPLPRDESETLLQIEAAKAYCRTCPVAKECLAHALGNGSVGIWGGLTDAERDALRRSRTEKAS
jgi:WhiB family redox-sensing transcriptional regulator